MTTIATSILVGLGTLSGQSMSRSARGMLLNLQIRVEAYYSLFIKFHDPCCCPHVRQGVGCRAAHVHVNLAL